MTQIFAMKDSNYDEMQSIYTVSGTLRLMQNIN